MSLLFPILVQDLIDWYKWRVRIINTIIEYNGKIYIDEGIIRYKSSIPNVAYRLNWRETNLAQNGFLTKTVWDFVKNTGAQTHLPQRYSYSSGLKNPWGYK